VHELKPLSETPPKPDFQPSSAVHSLVIYMYKHCRAIREVLACNKIEIDWKIKRVGTLRSQVHWLRD